MKTAEVRDILDEQPAITLERRHFIRFLNGTSWIDVELRDGDVTIRGSRPLAVHPIVGNEIVVRVT